MTASSQKKNPSQIPRRLWAAVLVVFGATLVVGGAALVYSGGSAYYLIAGLAVVIAGVLTWRGDGRGARLYGVFLLGSLVWALYEVGFTTWPLVARLACPVVLGMPLLWRRMREKEIASPARSHFKATAWGSGLVLAVLLGTGLHTLVPDRVDPLLARGVATAAPSRLSSPLAELTGADWPQWGNDIGGTRFSALAQVTPANVKNLQVAWEADIGSGPLDTQASLEVTPINVGNSLYVCNAYNVVLSLDAETGTQNWHFDMTREQAPEGKPCRGVSYYRVPGATGACAERIIATNQTPELIALDALTGKPCEDFGNHGRVGLSSGFGNFPRGYTYVSSAPLILNRKIVFGGAVQDGQYWGEPSGVIRAYDAVSGRFAWAFDLARPDDHGEPTGDRTYTPSTPNSWGPISADPALGLVYLPIGNATPDYYGGARRPFDDAFSSSVIALDVDTGALRWRYQTVHHDLWDYDAPAQPTLVDLPTANGVRHALIEPTKRGEVFVLDRTNGMPIKTIQEMPVPQGGVPAGERLSPTQPFSVGMPSFRAPQLRESDMWGLTPVDQMVCRILFKQSRYEGPMTPHTLDKPTIVEPGDAGGVDWGSVAIDVDRGIMLVNSNRVPGRPILVTRAEATAKGWKLFDGRKGQSAPNSPQENTPYAAQQAQFLSPLGVPCNAPPWGLMTAVDLVRGQVVWSRPLGSAQDSGPLGLRSHLPFMMGVPNSGGSIATRGGLTFIGASADGRFRAFDTATGDLAWEVRLPAGGQATPMSYLSRTSGRQFVVIAAGGHPSLKTRIGSKIVAYALPR